MRISPQAPNIQTLCPQVVACLGRFRRCSLIRESTPLGWALRAHSTIPLAVLSLCFLCVLEDVSTQFQPPAMPPHMTDSCPHETTSQINSWLQVTLAMVFITATESSNYTRFLILLYLLNLVRSKK